MFPIRSKLRGRHNNPPPQSMRKLSWNWSAAARRLAWLGAGPTARLSAASPVWTNELQQRVVELVAGGTRRVCDICRILKISEASFHKYTSMPKIKRQAAALLAHKGFKYEAIARKLRIKTWQEVRDIAIEAGACAKTADGKWVSVQNDLAVTMPSHPPKRRKCLRCSKEFLSDGPQNRMCDRCRGASAGEYDPEPARV